VIRWLRPIRPSLVPVRRLSWQTWSLLGVPSIAGSDIPPAAPPLPSHGCCRGYKHHAIQSANRCDDEVISAHASITDSCATCNDGTADSCPQSSGRTRCGTHAMLRAVFGKGNR